MGDTRDESCDRQAFKELKQGMILDCLRRDGFPAWIELVSGDCLTSELGALPKSSSYKPQQVLALARRLVLSRDRDLLSKLSWLWQGFGSTPETCYRLVDAVEKAVDGWPRSVRQLEDDAPNTRLSFSGAHADFVETMQHPGRQDAHDVLGKAIQATRLADEHLHVGFPLVLHGDEVGRALRQSVWIETTGSRPSRRLTPKWDALCGKCARLVAGSESEQSLALSISLPDWLDVLLDQYHDETWESAGLSVTLQMLAIQQKRMLPYGVGFTGRWDEDGRLRGIEDLRLKLQAARDAGVFLLVACSTEKLPDAISGIQLVLLPEYLRLDEVVQRVNRICAETGLTEYRWRKQSLELQPNTSSNVVSPVLPLALDKESRLPKGFVGRHQQLDDLKQHWKNSQSKSHRTLLAVVAPARSGKTTLLAHWAKEFLPYWPALFSFCRDDSKRWRRKQLHDAIQKQIAARHCVLALTERTTRDNEAGSVELLNELISAAGTPVTILVDGIDEAESTEQSEILAYLQQITGEGITVIGTHPGDSGDLKNFQPLNLKNDSDTGLEDARCLIDEFAKEYEVKEHLRPFARLLGQPFWREGLAQRSGGNLWMLTDFLTAVRKDRAAWPESPDETPLRPVVRDYCEVLLQAMLGSDSDDKSQAVEVFLTYLTFLGEESWSVHDVRQIVDDELGTFGDWIGSRSGPLSKKTVQRVICFDGVRVGFHSPFLRDAAEQFFSGSLPRVATRFVGFLREMGQPSKGGADTNLFRCVVERVPYLLNQCRRFCDQHGLSFDSSKLFDDLLGRTTWAYRHLRSLCEAQGVSGCALLGDLRLLPSDDDTLTAETQAACQRLQEAINVLGWAIDEQPELFDRWWDVLLGLSEYFPRPTPIRSDEAVAPTLLVPVNGPNPEDCCYRDLLPTRMRLQGPVIELGSRLVFAIEPGALLVCPAGRDRAEQEQLEMEERTRRRLFLRLPSGQNIVSVVPVTDSTVAVLVRRESDGREVPTPDRVVEIRDVDSSRRKTVTLDLDVLAIASIREPEGTIIVVGQSRAGDVPPTLIHQVLDLDGNVLATETLPFVIAASSTVKLVAFSGDTWAIYVTRSLRLVLRRFSAGVISNIPITLPDVGVLKAICPVPGNCLAVAYQSASLHESRLAKIDDRGNIALVITLHTTSTEMAGRCSNQDATRRLSLLMSIPIGWHSGCGVVLCDGHVSWSVQLEREAIPAPFPPAIAASSTFDRLLDCTPVLGTKDGRILAINTDRHSAVLLSSSPADDVVINPVFPELKVLGCRNDGAVVICNGGYYHRTATPPFDTGRREESFGFAGGEILRLTSDGRVLSQDDVKRLIETAGERGGAWGIGAWRIWDVATDERGEVCVLGTKTDRLDNYKVVLGQFKAEKKRPQAIWSIADVFETEGDYFGFGQIVASAENGIVAVSLESAKQGESVGIWLINLSRREHRRIGNGLDAVKLFSLPDGDILTCVNRAALPYATAEVAFYKALGQRTQGPHLLWTEDSRPPPALDDESLPPGTLLENLPISTESFVMDSRGDEAGYESRIASIITDWWRWSLEITILHRPAHEAVWRVAGNRESHELKGEVVTWTRRSGWLVLGFKSGRIEVRNLTQLGQVSAVGYVIGRPNSMTICQSAAGRFIVVSAGGDLVWFQLTDTH